MRPQFTCLLPLLAALSAGPALGSPGGELDPAFGDHGRVLLRDPPFEEFSGVDIFVDPGSGKLLAVGDGYHGDRLLRFNSDGSLDQGFDGQGTKLFDLDGDSLDIYDVERLADGRLLLAGALNVYGDPGNVIHGSALLARMHADGTPDTSFGVGGRAVFQLGGVYESVSEIMLQPDGRIVVFGSTNRSGKVEWILARYTPDGAPDNSFGSSTTPGIGVVNVLGIDAQLASIVRQSDGKFLICGDATLGSAAPDPFNIVAIRIQAGGLPDPTFGNNGMLLLGGWRHAVDVNACLELADGHIIFAGSTGSGERQRAAAWRMAPDGRLDTDFGVAGMTALDTDTQSAATAMLVMADGSLAIAGTQWKPDVQWKGDNNAWFWWADMMVARLDLTSGAVDPGFGRQGVTVVDFGAHEYSSNAVATSLKQQPDGKLIIIGSQTDLYDWYPWFSIAMVRIDPYGAGSNGVAGMTDTIVAAPANGGEVKLSLRRTGGSTGQLSVDYRTEDATATAGEDYVAVNGTVVWSDGDMAEKTISITVSKSTVTAISEHFNVTLSNSSGGLAMDVARIWVPHSNPPGPGGGNGDPGNVDGDNGGGGVELWFLLLLAIVLRHKKRGRRIVCPFSFAFFLACGDTQDYAPVSRFAFARGIVCHGL
jgi:uncharacterized delta-60 repeat protein